MFRIGHCVFKVSNADEAVKWFRDTLGMLVTDRIHVPDNPAVTLGTFLRCNKGKNPADHHSILCLHRTPDDIKVHHSSSVPNPDAVHIGHYYLKAHGYQSEWGVGRHLLGSQVFDYWRDPWGHMFERLCRRRPARRHGDAGRLSRHAGEPRAVGAGRHADVLRLTTFA